MKEYSLASVLVLMLALGAVAVSGLWRDRALWVGFVIFAGMTMVADIGLTGLGVYGYDRRYNAGLLAGKMPIEDLGYGLALYLLSIASWTWGERRDR